MDTDEWLIILSISPAAAAKHAKLCLETLGKMDWSLKTFVVEVRIRYVEYILKNVCMRLVFFFEFILFVIFIVSYSKLSIKDYYSPVVHIDFYI